MNWKSLIVTVSLGILPGGLIQAQQPGETPEYEVMATSRGNFIAWPVGALEKSDAMAFAEKAEAQLSAAGAVSPQLVSELARKKEEGGRHTPFHNRYRPLSARTVIVRTGDACASPDSVCSNRAHESCRKGDPDCRCACADPNAASGAVANAMRNKRAGIPLIILAPEGANPSAAVKAALQSMARSDLFLKID
jgi:hypothetical protein